jgi:transposase
MSSRRLPDGGLGMARVTLDGKRRWHISFPGLQPPLERQHKCSKHRARTKRQIAAIHQTVRDRRGNWIEVQSTRLVREHDVIAVEDLRVRNIVRRPRPAPDPDRPGVFLPNQAAAKAGLNRSIHQQGWSVWLRRENAEESGVIMVQVPAAHTSDGCRICGQVAAENRESQAVFRCLNCGHTGHADREAAHNLLARAVSIRLAPAPGPGASAPPRRAAHARRPIERSGNSQVGLAHAA